jgi:hypothetical protein
MYFAQLFSQLWSCKLIASTFEKPQNVSMDDWVRTRPYLADALKAVDDIDRNTSWPTRRIRSSMRTQHLYGSHLEPQIPTPNRKQGGVYGPRPQ